MTSFHIERERIIHDGVLVARPRAIDERIVFLLETNRIRTIDDYTRWLKKNIRYKKDSVSHWPDPQETLAKKYGDCKNFAILTSAVLKVLGYQPTIMVCHLKEGGHAISVFQMDGYYCWFDNATFIKTSSRSLPVLVREINKRYKLISLSELNSNNNHLSIVYAKASVY